MAANTEIISIDNVEKSLWDKIVNIATTFTADELTALSALAEDKTALVELAENAEAILALLDTEETPEENTPGE